MTDLINSLGVGRESALEKGFEARAGYFAAMDCLIYLKEDVSYRAVRLSPYVTVLLHPHEEKAVGVKIKSFRAEVIEKVRDILRANQQDLTENEIVVLQTVLEVAFTLRLGQVLTTEAESERRIRWENEARNLLKDAGQYRWRDIAGEAPFVMH